MSEDAPLQELQDIIGFAIEKEQESADFYNSLLGMVKSQAVAAEIRKIVEMEERHRDVLRNIDVEAYSRSLDDRGFNLSIADYMVETEPTPEMSVEDLLKIAMCREKKAKEMYTDLAELFTHDEKQLFKNLAAEESRHEHLFERQWIGPIPYTTIKGSSL